VGGVSVAGAWGMVSVGQVTPATGYYGAGSFTYRAYDGELCSDTATVLIHVLCTTQIPGDANRDGAVNADDAAIVAKNWGQAVSGGARMGDFDGDGMVGAADASILAANWGTTAKGTGPTSVPEPGGMTMLVGYLGVLSWSRRRLVG
jgi:hypothetical protein